MINTLLRLLTGKITIGFAIVIVILIGARVLLKNQRAREHESEKTAIESFAPALNEISSQKLVSSKWSYSGPAGKAVLQFHSDGTLTTLHDDGTESSGSWKISGNMLSASIPGEEASHQGIFRDSTDEIVGPIPGAWSATRMKAE